MIHYTLGCRCWAEPVDAEEYARQTLISAVNDNAEKWTDADFAWHYLLGNGTPVALQETGYLASIIDYFGEVLGIYKNVNEQIISAALNSKEGSVPYGFKRTYDFEPVLYTFRNSTIEGTFEGDAKLKKSGNKQYLVINGIMTYAYSDRFEDPLSIVETLQRRIGLTREQAQEFLDSTPEIIITPYDISDRWKTKFNATVDVTAF